MKKLLGFSCWALVFGLLLLGLDQFFLRLPASVSPHREARTFYLDFRTRLLALASGEKEENPKSAGKKQPNAPLQSAPPATPAVKTPPAKVPTAPTSVRQADGEAQVRYIYVDKAGDLHFADSLQEVPAPYRGEARPMSR